MNLQDVKVLVVTLSPGYWGKGDTLAEALEKAKYIKGTEQYAAYLVHPDTIVDGMGGFRFPEGFPPREIFAGRVVMAKPAKKK